MCDSHFLVICAGFKFVKEWFNDDINQNDSDNIEAVVLVVSARPATVVDLHALHDSGAT